MKSLGILFRIFFHELFPRIENYLYLLAYQIQVQSGNCYFRRSSFLTIYIYNARLNLKFHIRFLMCYSDEVARDFTCYKHLAVQ